MTDSDCNTCSNSIQCISCFSYVRNYHYGNNLDSDHHNTTGQYDPRVHGFNGVNSVSVGEYPSAIDGRVIQATKELPNEFPFNLDYNSGYHLGIGE